MRNARQERERAIARLKRLMAHPGIAPSYRRELQDTIAELERRNLRGTPQPPSS